MNRKELEAQMTLVLMPVAPHDWLIERCCDLAELYARQQLLQQTQCTTLREELEQMLNSEQKATDEEGDIDTKYEMYKYVDAIKMVLLLIDARQPVA